MRSLFLLLVCLTMLAMQAQSQVDTIHAGDGKMKIKYLPEGTQRYLVYVNRDGQKRSIWLWERATTRENWHGQSSIVIRQAWITSDTGYNRRDILSVVDEKTFAPIYHTSSNPKTAREAFNYLPNEIVTADTVKDAGRKDFRQVLTEPSFNWELDLETFPLLPLKEGKTFVINFYHPGSPKGPGWYNYTVTGSEKIAAVNGEWIDCYKLYTEYANNQGHNTWWLSKKTHEVLKMEEHYGKVTRYKIKLGVGE